MKEGQKFGKLLLIKKVSKGQKKPQISAKWLCKCDCGGEKIVTQNCLQIGSTRSCGCLVTLNEKDYNEEIKLRIKKYIEVDDKKCWIWIGAKHRQGYGQIAYRSKALLAHRVSWEMFIGKIPLGMKVCHKCDVPSCVNPDHLFLGTQKDNVEDSREKERFKPGTLPRQIKLNWEQVQEIKVLNKQGMTRKELQEKFQVGQTCIAKILTGKSWNINWIKEL